MAVVSPALPTQQQHHPNPKKSAENKDDFTCSFRLDDDSINTASTRTTMTEDCSFGGSHTTTTNDNNNSRSNSSSKNLRFFDQTKKDAIASPVQPTVKRRQFARKQPERRRVERVDSVKLTRKHIFLKNMDSSALLNDSACLDLAEGVDEDASEAAAPAAANTLANMRAAARASAGRTGRATTALGASKRKPLVRTSSMKNSKHRNPSRDRSIRRSVSYQEEGALENVKEIDKVHELIDNADDELWYNAQEIEASKYEIDDLVRDYEDSKEAETSQDGGGGDDDEEETCAMNMMLHHEPDDGHSMRGLERKTEAGSWMCFQWRNQMLDAVLDNQENSEQMADLCRQATQVAVTIAVKRAEQDWLAVKQYLSDVVLPEIVDE